MIASVSATGFSMVGSATLAARGARPTEPVRSRTTSFVDPFRAAHRWLRIQMFGGLVSALGREKVIGAPAALITGGLGAVFGGLTGALIGVGSVGIPFGIATALGMYGDHHIKRLARTIAADPDCAHQTFAALLTGATGGRRGNSLPALAQHEWDGNRLTVRPTSLLYDPDAPSVQQKFDPLASMLDFRLGARTIFEVQRLAVAGEAQTVPLTAIAGSLMEQLLYTFRTSMTVDWDPIVQGVRDGALKMPLPDPTACRWIPPELASLLEAQRTPESERTPVIFLCTHDSFMEFAVVVTLLGDLFKLRPVARGAFYTNPVLRSTVGEMMEALRFHILDREHSGVALRQSMDIGREMTSSESRHSIVFWPGGTRSRDGRLMRAHQRGLAALASTASGATIIPVGINNVWETWPADAEYGIRPGTTGQPISVGFGKPVLCANLLQSCFESLRGDWKPQLTARRIPLADILRAHIGAIVLKEGGDFPDGDAAYSPAASELARAVAAWTDQQHKAITGRELANKIQTPKRRLI